MHAPPRRILITRLSAIGDCVLSMPVAGALRDHFPEARITWLAEPAAAQLLDGHRGIDHLVVVRKGWLKSWREMARVRRLLRSLEIDTAIDVQSLTKSATAGWLSGAPRRIGFTSPQGREAAPWLNTVRVPRTAPHMVDSYLELLRPLGIHQPSVRFDVPEQPAAAQSVSLWIEDQMAPAEFVLINPGAGWESKRWLAERYAEVAAGLGEQHGLASIVLWCGERERRWAEQIVAGAGDWARLAPRTTLTELAALARRACLFVGSDTGPMHLAAAVGTPCVALFGPTFPAECGPYGTGHIALHKQYVPGTRRQRRRADNSAMRAIRSEDVLQACGELVLRTERCQFQVQSSKFKVPSSKFHVPSSKFKVQSSRLTVRG